MGRLVPIPSLFFFMPCSCLAVLFHLFWSSQLFNCSPTFSLVALAIFLGPPHVLIASTTAQLSCPASPVALPLSNCLPPFPPMACRLLTRMTRGGERWTFSAGIKP